MLARFVRWCSAVAVAVAVAGVSAAAAAVPAAAQAPMASRSVGRAYAVVGLGAGTAALRCTICRGDPQRSLAAHLGAGWQQTPTFGVGLEGQSWLDVFGTGAGQVLLHAQVAARWRPYRHQPLVVTGGLGLLRHRVTDGPLVLESQAAAAQVRAAWDVRLRDGVALSPYVALLAGVPARLRAANGFAPARDARVGLAQSGIALTVF